MTKRRDVIQSSPLEDAKRELKARQQIIEAQRKTIDGLREKRSRSIPRAKKQRSKAGSWIRVVIPDTHGCYVDPEAISAFLGDLESISGSVREIVMLGDHLECGAFLAGHYTLGYVSEADFSHQQDIDACNDLLDKIQKTCPKANIWYIEGNHERRIVRWCMTQAQRHGADAQYLLDCHGAASVLRLSDRGITHIEQGKHYCDLTVPATIKLGRCYFTHGSSHAKHAASVMLQMYNANVVFGHVHRALEASASTVGAGVVRSWCPGCLCLKQRLWSHDRPSQWNHGYALQMVAPDGDFLHINVPLFEGRSLLRPLISQMA